MTLRGLQKLPRISKRGVAITGAIYTLVVSSTQSLLVFQALFIISPHSLLLAYIASPLCGSKQHR